MRHRGETPSPTTKPNPEKTMNTNISFEQNGDMIATPETGGAVYIGKIDSDGDIRLVPGTFEISEDEIIEAIIETMIDDPSIEEQTWNIDFTKAAAKAGEKSRIPSAYLHQARIDEYREPNMSEWWRAVRDAENRDECHGSDGNITARFWTDGAIIWVTPDNIAEPDARIIQYRFESGVGYVPVDL